MSGLGMGMDFGQSRAAMSPHGPSSQGRAPAWGLSDLAFTDFARPGDQWMPYTAPQFTPEDVQHDHRSTTAFSQDPPLFHPPPGMLLQRSAPLSLPPRSPYSAVGNGRSSSHSYSGSAESPPLTTAEGEWLGSAAASALSASLSESAGFPTQPPTKISKPPSTPPSRSTSLYQHAQYSPVGSLDSAVARSMSTGTPSWPYQREAPPLASRGNRAAADGAFYPYSSASLAESVDPLSEPPGIGPQSLPSRPIPSPIGHGLYGSHSSALEIGSLDLGSSVTSSTTSPQSPKQRVDQLNHENQHTSRSCVLRNVAPGVDDDALRNMLEAFGPVRELGAQQRGRGGRGSVTVTFFDLRHTKQVVKQLSGQTVQSRQLDVRYCTASEESALISGQQHDRRHGLSDFNQGTLVVFNVDVVTRAEEIRRIFGSYGSIKEIRETPHKRHHRFIEFYDVRDAEQAMRALNKTELGGKKIKIEISRPGGSRGNGGLATSPGRAISGAPVLALGASALPSGERNAHITPPNSPPLIPVTHSPTRIGSPCVSSNGKFSLDVGKVGRGEDQRTALMVRNIPNKYNQRMLLATLEENHHGQIDFFYLPIDFKNKCNVGYCFINFTQAKHIADFHREFHGKKWGKFNSEKVCEITYARIQGRMNLIAHFQNSSLMNEDPKCRPVIFGTDGEQKEFPVGPHVRTRRGPSARESKASEQVVM